ncbi:hypothetical protein GF339_22915 [candidate division KSB3 bacterium]|uniref:Uncharacterized protein n=1 Tax=candidate division KSB3 bacterium TaxID=2044937 RepID=A0A9D5K0N1_9BACT|nr:hypothetical protein [candidate division KSB3 bacterium]MBD3327456.1 hypothetical protein [candidate division KSB3 bacterium]
MATMTFGKLEIDPTKNPAVLDTATWDPKSAWEMLNAVEPAYWQSVQDALTAQTSLPRHDRCTLYPGSHARYQGSDFLLAGLQDGQQIFIEIGQRKAPTELGEALGAKSLSNGQQIAAYKTDAAVIDRFCRIIKPEKGPKALKATPRLGIGVRMSAAAWPGIWQAMHKQQFAANAIQNSLRELNMLEDLLAGKPAHSNYLFSFGTIDEGHTGSTFEGLWVAGVLSALRSDTTPLYGADADHIMVKRGPEGMSRAKRVIDAGRYYTFFTLDVSDILNYAAIKETSAATAEAYVEDIIQDVTARTDLLAYHSQPHRIGGQDYNPDAAMLGRLVGKYWTALEAAQELYGYIKSFKQDIPFDLELSIDENPPEVKTCESLTQDVELMFLLLEIQRRQLPITHIAPNFGVEKGVDYRCPEGLEELEPRVRRQYHMASEYGLMLDCHSGDDLKSPTRQVFGRATDGNIHFKVSPSLQVVFGETLNDLFPEHFQFWWDDTLAYARREAEAGASVAAECIQEYQNSPNPVPSARTALFEHFNFATVGKRDANGQFCFREKFYDLPAEFYQEYTRRIERLLTEVAHDVFNR